MEDDARALMPEAAGIVRESVGITSATTTAGVGVADTGNAK